MKSIILVFCIISIQYLLADNTEKLRPVNQTTLNLLNWEKTYWKRREVSVQWDYSTNITDANLFAMRSVLAEKVAFDKELKEIENSAWQNVSSYDIRRQFKAYTSIGVSALEEKDLRRLTTILAQMENISSTSRENIIHQWEDNEILDTDMMHLFYLIEHPNFLALRWLNWREIMGAQVKELYPEYVELLNKAARLNGLEDASEMWLENYEDETFASQIEELWMQVKPLYLQMHAYLRSQFRKKSGGIPFQENGPIPAHYLDHIFKKLGVNIQFVLVKYPVSITSHLRAFFWKFNFNTNILHCNEDHDWTFVTSPYPLFTPDYNWKDVGVPYPHKQSNITEALHKNNYSAKIIFETAEDFFISINMTKMPETFWNDSILEKPHDGRSMECDDSAFDFYDDHNYRIKQCTEATDDHFYKAQHHMGEIEYFLQYTEQPIQFKNPANNGFLDAVGDVITLSTLTTKYLKQLGLLDDSDDEEVEMNRLYYTGTRKIMGLPLAYITDLWRWKVFKGEITPENYNCKWWELQEEYEGIEPPVDRSEADFDLAGSDPIIRGYSFIRNFVSTIIQFQFHKALCEKAGQYSPNDPEKLLHKCNIYGSAEAGNALKKMLAMGSSKPWPDAMEVLTGQRTMNASAMLEYFQPLHDWLRDQNRKNNATIGWEKSTKVCHKEKFDSIGILWPKKWNRHKPQRKPMISPTANFTAMVERLENMTEPQPNTVEDMLSEFYVI